MNTEQIVKMGWEAGLCDEDGADDNSIYIDEHLTRFAKLVAASEREACAQLCDALHKQSLNLNVWAEITAETCADAIRARK
jgi:hypothetical protein